MTKERFLLLVAQRRSWGGYRIGSHAHLRDTEEFELKEIRKALAPNNFNKN